MHGLLDAATVLTGDGQWGRGYEIDALSCGRVIENVDICDPGTFDEADLDEGTGFAVVPFFIYGRQKFGTRCAPADAEAAMTAAMGDASENQVARNFWYGDVPDWGGAVGLAAGTDINLFLTHADVDTVVAGASVQATVSKVLKAAYAKHPEIQPIIHLGFLSALQLSASKMDELDIPFAVSPGYPENAVAVTGPIVVHLGSVETTRNENTSINRRYIEGTRLAAVEFDPCLAVRAA